MKIKILIIIVFALVFRQTVFAYEYPWPGILPDRPILYKIKVLRNKIIEKMIYSDVKRIEFYLLMADKTLYASSLLQDKEKKDLARETALKGENYMSLLVSEYVKIKTVPDYIDKKIDNAHVAHQALIEKLGFQDVDYFSKENYKLIQQIRNEK